MGNVLRNDGTDEYDNLNQNLSQSKNINNTWRNKMKTFDEICDMKELHAEKNRNYGNSFGKQFEKF